MITRRTTLVTEEDIRLISVIVVTNHPVDIPSQLLIEKGLGVFGYQRKSIPHSYRPIAQYWSLYGNITAEFELDLAYDTVHKSLVGAIGAGSDVETGEGCRIL